MQGLGLQDSTGRSVAGPVVHLEVEWKSGRGGENEEGVFGIVSYAQNAGDPELCLHCED